MTTNLKRRTAGEKRDPEPGARKVLTQTCKRKLGPGWIPNYFMHLRSDLWIVWCRDREWRCYVKVIARDGSRPN